MMIVRKRPAKHSPKTVLSSQKKRPASVESSSSAKRPAGAVPSLKRPAAAVPNKYSGTPVCWYFQNGGCDSGDHCKYLHVDRDVLDCNPASSAAESFTLDRDSAGIRFVVDSSLGSWLLKRSGQTPCSLPTGPLRVRIAGDLSALGRVDHEQWDAMFGTDLFWEGDRWTSVVFAVSPEAPLKFQAAALIQDPMHPGLLLGRFRREVHDARSFTYGRMHSMQTPAAGEVAEIFLEGSSCRAEVKPRYDVVARAGSSLPGPAPAHSGESRVYTFEDPAGYQMYFALYLPTSYDASSQKTWPLIMFLHSMHCSVERDNNMFYESDTPLRLLATNSPLCPKTLQRDCIFLVPTIREDTGTIWLRDGWFSESTHNQDKEDALAALIELVAKSCRVDRKRISVLGSSMGAYASLELARRWPRFFSAVALAAAHYEVDPVEPLIERLAEDGTPLWFFHATNDSMCPYADVESMVTQLRARSKGEVRFTSYFDDWSISGHHVDPVAFYSSEYEQHADSETQPKALGEDLFSWLAEQRLRDIAEPTSIESNEKHGL